MTHHDVVNNQERFGLVKSRQSIANSQGLSLGQERNSDAALWHLNRAH
ncbi:MAG: hypothetical protein ACKOGA_00140 [Planctomycetaceae bacterium]